MPPLRPLRPRSQEGLVSLLARPNALRRPARAAALGLALAGLLALSACGSDDESASSGTPVAPEAGRLTVRAFEWGFEPDTIVLQQDEEVRIDFVNDGEIIHNWAVDDQPDADILEVESTGPLQGDEGEVFVGAEPEESGHIAFVPLEAGTFEFYCTVQSHRGLGMEGTLIIE